MKIFKVNEHITVVCQSENTRYGFRHLATLMVDGKEDTKAKACYYNRTWERYEFESVFSDVLHKSKLFDSQNIKALLDSFSNY